MDMKIICLEEPALYNLIDSVVKRLSNNKKDPWVDKAEAMHILKVKSSTTLQSYRDNLEIKFSQLDNSSLIIYHRQSLYDFLERNAKGY